MPGKRERELERKLRQRDEHIARLERENCLLRERLEAVETSLKNLQRRSFGRRSERLDHPGQCSIADQLLAEADLREAWEAATGGGTDEEDDDDAEDDSSPPVIDPDTVSDWRPPKQERPRGKRLPLPEDLEQVEIVCELPEEKRLGPDGTPLTRVRWVTSEKLAYRPGVFYKEIHKRAVYGKPFDDTTPRVATPARAIIPKGKAADSLIAWIATQKYADHLPCYRQDDIFARSGQTVTRADQSRWLLAACEFVAPVWKAIWQSVLSNPAIGLDDTTHRLLEPGEGQTRTVRLWAYAAGEEAFYHYTPTREGRWPRILLASYHGHVICDDFPGHHALFLDQLKRLSSCLAHVRRKFVECGDPARAGPILEIIGRIYAVEERARHLSRRKRLGLRQEYSVDLMVELAGQLRRLERSTTPRSHLGLAVRYTLRLYDGLSQFLLYPYLPPDNNDTERAMRRCAMGRKNHLFVGSRQGGRSCAIWMTLVECCRRSGVDPFAYLCWVFRELHAGRADHTNLRPAVYAESNQDNAVKNVG
jgi:transposase